jgi:hypothetical protein
MTVGRQDRQKQLLLCAAKIHLTNVQVLHKNSIMYDHLGTVRTSLFSSRVKPMAQDAFM